MNRYRLLLPMLLAGLCAASRGGTIFLPAYPDRILVIDEASQQIVDKIPSDIGIPNGVARSYDRKKPLRDFD